MYKKGTLYAFERSVLRFLRQTSTLPPDAELTPYYRRLWEELQAVHQDQDSQLPAGGEEIMYWLQARIESRPMADIVRESM